MTLGLYGGTFNPIHHGHLIQAGEAGRAAGLDKVLFIPSAQPPHKKNGQVAPARHRLEMVRLALAGNPAFELCDVEVRRSGPSYTIDTVDHFEKASPGTDLAFILGLDAFAELDTWHRFEELAPRLHWIVTNRGGMDSSCLERVCHPRIREVLQNLDWQGLAVGGKVQAWPAGFPKGLSFVRIPAIEIASTTLRARASAGRSLRYFVPPSVEHYVEEHQLYAP